ncbi:MAG: hypothetical protein LIP00_00935 [Parabacteroides sp.]|nr:hypothetical protein [Parabacteroides sp.]
MNCFRVIPFFLAVAILIPAGCIRQHPQGAATPVDSLPLIRPDYTSVTIPPGIAPLNFALCSGEKGEARFVCGSDSVTVTTSSGVFAISPGKWKRLLAGARDKNISVTLTTGENGNRKTYRPFTLTVSPDEIDPYLVYRRIAPGHQLWGEMGIYQRELASFRESPLLENRQLDHNCMNCHAFCNHDPEKMLLHIRAAHACTVFAGNGRIGTFDTKTEHTLSALVYPGWHPSGKYVAFSVNNTTQDLDALHRTEVYDKASDVVVYDVENETVFTTGLLASPGCLETFPAFSPDGRSLYFCSAPALPLPDSIRQLRYSLCRIAFDPGAKTFGTQVDTLFDAEKERLSFLFPRLSPDGKFLLGTVAAYGTFPIWHPEADLRMIRLDTGQSEPCSEANSDDTESYHAWSSNGKWVVFSSRRLDGLYTRLFISHVDSNGCLSKPFPLPQKNGPGYYDALMQSYNVPEFVKGKVPVKSYRLSREIRKGGPKPVRFGKKE